MRNDGITLVFLTQGKVAIIDSVDAHWALRDKWRFNGGYAIRTRQPTDGPGSRYIWLHREILHPDSGEEGDHINRDTLDNRRCNLRIASRSQNGANRGLYANNTTGFRGIAYRARSKKGKPWRSGIQVNGRTLHLGCFYTAEEAARMYDKAALEHFGPFASLNFPDVEH